MAFTVSSIVKIDLLTNLIGHNKPINVFRPSATRRLDSVRKNKRTLIYINIARYIFECSKYSSILHFSYEIDNTGKPFVILYANFPVQDYLFKVTKLTIYQTTIL